MAASARPPSTSIFIGNVGFSASEEELSALFKQVGPLKSFRLVADRETGKPKGYAFAEYFDVPTAQSAQRNLNRTDYNGRTLRVDFADSEKHSSEHPGTEHRGPPKPAVVGKNVAQGAGQTMAAALGGSGGAGEQQISDALSKMTRPQIFEIMNQMKALIQQNPAQARQILVQNPQLTKALFQAQILLGMVKPAPVANGPAQGAPGPMVSQQPAQLPAPIQLPPPGQLQYAPQPGPQAGMPFTQPGYQQAQQPQMQAPAHSGFQPQPQPRPQALPAPMPGPRPYAGATGPPLAGPRTLPTPPVLQAPRALQGPQDPRQQQQQQPQQSAPFDPRQQGPADPRQQPPVDPRQQAPVDPRQQGGAMDPRQQPTGPPVDPRMQAPVDPRLQALQHPRQQAPHDPRQMQASQPMPQQPAIASSGFPQPVQGMVDPRHQQQPPPMQQSPMQPQQPKQQQPAGSAAPVLGQADQQALLQQVLNLTPQQIAMLPDAQQQQVIELQRQLRAQVGMPSL